MMTFRWLSLLLPTILLFDAGAAQARPSGSSQSRAALEQQLAAQANDVETMVEMASVLLDRSRSGNDPHLLARANALVARVIKAAPDNPAAHTLNARSLMVAHRFDDALAAVDRAQALGAVDVATLSAKADALIELGRYDEAEAAIQRLLDEHYGAGALSRSAHFRFLHGDLGGAIELVKRSLEVGRLAPFDQAWLRLQLAELLLFSGDLDGARRTTLAAEGTSPAAALALRARVSEALGQQQEAATLLRSAAQRELRPEFVFELWRLARQRNDHADADRQRALLDAMARLDEASGSLDRRLFVLWYAEHDEQLLTAERLARAELAARPDIYSQDALAWVLHRQGRSREALPYAERAIALGTPDPKLLAHSAAIFRALDDPRGNLTGAGYQGIPASALPGNAPAVASQ